MKTYIFKDVSERIETFPFWGKQICLIFCAEDINKAIESFEKHYPQHCSKGRMKQFISVSIVF